MIDSLVRLVCSIPGHNDCQNYERMKHADRFGHIMVLQEEGEITGYAEMYRMRSIPDYPVLPLPKNEPDGEYVYCWAASCERGRIRGLINLARRCFKNCRYLVWHNHRRNNKLHVERI